VDYSGYYKCFDGYSHGHSYLKVLVHEACKGTSGASHELGAVAVKLHRRRQDGSRKDA
jgi:hypothetical protein